MTITGVDNSVDAPDKEVTVSATVAGGNGVAAPAPQTLTLTDDEGAPTNRNTAAFLGFDPATVNVTEGGRASFTVKLTQAVASPVTFSWQTADRTATAGADYSAQAATNVTLAAGVTSATLGVQTSTDALVEGDETFAVTLSAGSMPSGVSLGTATAIATITDDDTATLGFDPAAVTVAEGGRASFTVKLTRAVASPVTFSWRTADRTATAGADYGAQAATNVTLAAGVTSATLDVQTSTDALVEGDETFAVMLSVGSMPSGVSLGTATAIATITDDDTATLGFDPAAVTVVEGGRASFTVKLAQAVASVVTFSWHTADITATFGSDYTPQVATVVTIPAGGTSATLEVQTLSDALVEGDETFEARLAVGNLPSGVALDAATATATISDDDAATLGMYPATVTVVEGGTATFVVKLSQAAASDIAFICQTADGTATAGSDYTAEAPTLVTITAGNTSATLEVQTMADTLVEGDETFEARLGAGILPNGITLDAPTSTATISDDDTAVLGFAPATVTVAEGGIAPFTVKLTHAVASAVTFSWQTDDGTATAGSDFEAQVATAVTIAPGDTSATLEVPTMADTLAEGNEAFAARLTANNLPSGVNLGTATATAIITDDDWLSVSPWLARFGRTMTEQVLDAVDARLRAQRQAGAEIKLAGHALPWHNGAGDATDAGGPLGDGLGRVQSAPQPPTSRELLAGSSGTWSGALGASNTRAEPDGINSMVWIRGAVTDFDGREADLTVDGEVWTGLGGTDWTSERWRAGLLVGHAQGTGGYRNSDCRGARCAGKVEASLTGLYPYAGLTLMERLSAWAVLGYGGGEVTVAPEGGEMIKTDLSLVMGAAGIHGELLAPTGSKEGLTLAMTSDGRFTRTSSGAAEDADGVRMMAEDADIWQASAGVEGSWRFLLGPAATLTPSAGVGLRLDGGAAESGYGAYSGGRLSLASPKSGFSLDLAAHGLMAHQSPGFREWGASAAMVLDPSLTNRGLSLSLRQSLGGLSAAGTDALLTSELPARLGLTTRRLQHVIEVQLGYGIAVFDGSLIGTPHAGLTLSEVAREYRLGWRLNSAWPGAPGFEADVEATRTEPAAGDEPAEHGVVLRGSVRW